MEIVKRDKIKLNSKTKNKILVLGFILIALVGVFGYGRNADAALPAPNPQLQSARNACLSKTTPQEKDTCLKALIAGCPSDARTGLQDSSCTNYINEALMDVGLSSFNAGTGQTQTTAGPQNTPPFQKKIDEGCESLFSTKTTLGGCILKLAYYTLFQIPSGLLYIAAIFFNFLMSMVLQNSTYNHGFINGAWEVVRDLSNIFFILILLYVAIKTVLNMGGHETKSIITSVIIMAVLINFSLFFTKIVIDSSNILALIFYDKLDPRYKDSDGIKKERPNITVGPNKEKDLSGAIYKNFNVTKLLNEDFITKLSVHEVQVRTINGDQTVVVPTGSFLPLGMTLLIITISGVIMLFAAYTFFSSGIFFIGRIIELWILMISAPFAFMSFAVPKLAHTEYGWDKWTEKLLSTSFMAPIFMFFLYLIFLLLGSEPSIFDTFIDKNNDNAMVDMIKVFLPALIILGLLLKAKDMAKQGGGQFGEMVMTGAKVMGGLAIGGTALGTAAVGRKVIGGVAASYSNREKAISHGEAMFKHSKELDTWEQQTKAWKKAGGQGAAPVKPVEPPEPADFTWEDRIGARINKSQKRSGDVSHGRHEIDALKEKLHLQGVDDENLSSVDKENMESTYIKDHRSEIDKEITNGRDAKGKEVKLTTDDTKDENGVAYTDQAGNAIEAVGKSDYTTKRRQKVMDEMEAAAYAGAPGTTGDLDPNTGNLSKQGEKKVEDRLNKEFNEILRKAAGRIGKEKYEHAVESSQRKVGIADKISARSTSGSYDIRNIANMSIDKREGLSARATVGIIAAIATGMRMGLKQGAGVNSGTPQRAVFKDIGEVITQSFKGANFNLDFKSGGGSHGKDDHGTSGGGHH